MAIVLEAFVPSFVQILTGMAKDETILALGVGEEIDMLHERLDRILTFLADAELHRFESRAIDCWLKQLRDVMYDAEDIIDDCRCQGEKLGLARRSPSSSSSSSNVALMLRLCYSPLSCFSMYGFRHQCGNKIKSIVRRADNVLKDMSPLNLVSTPRDHRNLNYMLGPKKSTTVVKFDIVGKRIEDDTRMLVDLLLSKEQHYKQYKTSVFAILGIGGIGKTTLAQKIYNDEKLRANFCQVSPIWVCVSQHLSETDLLRTIVVRAGGNPGEAKEKKDLERILGETIKGKKFFLVLDDVRDDRVWDDILGMPLQSGLGESRILVTTPHEAVAKRMGAVHFHQVERMSIEDSWLLLSKMAFLDDGIARNMQNNALRNTGIRIADKCDGLPLALKAIAGVLRTKGKRQHDWEEVLQNPAWSMTPTELPEGVFLRALFLSYMELPSHLKQCFLYFALFPKDAELLRNRFVHLWIAEGFVEVTGDRLMEELAEGYWKELVQRNLLQPNPNWYDSQMCTMHDMIHSLARHVASEECFYKNLQEFNGKARSSFSWSTKPRRLYIENGGVQAISDVIKEHASLRALISPRMVKFPDDATVKLRCLRILNLQQSVIDELPRSIGDLMHLRYLNLSNSTIRELPESIGNLVNLQFLNLYGCRKLLTLPKCIVNMHKLRYINIYGTHLESMPTGIERLRRLVFLNGFIVSCSDANKGDGEGQPEEAKEDYRRRLLRSEEELGRSNLAELGSFSQLRYLYVYKLERASGGDEARAAALNAKSHLTNLWLCCTPGNPQHPYYEEEERRRIENVFEELLPPTCLDYLKIGDYFGLQYPTWMTTMEVPSLFLPNLRRLDLVNCRLCAQLPPLGLLPQLEHLRIRGATAVTSVGPELFGIGSDAAKRAPHSSFPKLKELVLQNMPNWEEWQWLEKEDDHHKSNLLPCLSLMILETCPKLRSLPKRLLLHASSLTELQIKGAESLTEVKNLLSVQVLDLEYNSLLQRVSNLPSLKKLRVTVCGQLKDVDKVGALQNVNIKDPDMESLPVWLLARRELQLRSLRKLEIRGSNQLLSRCLVKGPEWDKIKRIPCVDAYNAEDESTYIHYTKSPFSFVTNLSNTARS